MSDNPPDQCAPPSSAAGLKALTVTYQHARAQTGVARALSVLTGANQKSGFDCPGCAWPDPNERSLFEFCENGAKAILDEATQHQIGPAYFAEHSVTELRTKSDQELNFAGRLTHPLLRREGQDHYEAITYEQAYQIIAQQLATLDHPDQAAFYTSGRTSNEAAFLYQLMVRLWGTNNLPDCSNLCHESSGVALKTTLGIGKGTVRLSDFDAADLIFVIGQNPGTNHPRMLSALRSAKKGGACIVSVNPLVEAGLQAFAHPQEPSDLVEGPVSISDHFVRVAVGGDQALFRALNKRLFELEKTHPEAIDRAFVAKHTTSIEQLEQAAQEADYAELENLSGVSFEQIDHLARLVIDSRAIIACWAMGITQHENAVSTICEVSNFLLLRGNVGRPGAGACPVRGHSNVQGDRTMGIAPELPGPTRERLEAWTGLPFPKERGLDSVGTIFAMNEGRVRAFFSMGGNFGSACPDTELTLGALSKCSLLVHVSTKLNRSHLVPNGTSIILPCLGRSERDLSASGPQVVSVENSMGVVHASVGKLAPASMQLRSEARITCEMAQTLFSTLGERDERYLKASQLPWHAWAQNYDLVRNEIAHLLPGFEGYNERLREESGFELPNGPRERQFSTAHGKALFVADPVRRLKLEEDELVLMTLRSHDQFNTTVYSDSDRYRGIRKQRKVLLLHPQDMRARGLAAQTKIRITSYFRDQTRCLEGFFALPYDVPLGTAVAYFPEANPLIFADSYAERSRTPTSKSVRIRVEALAPS